MKTSKKTKWFIILIFLLIAGAIGLYLFIRNVPQFWTSQGIIEKKLESKAMLTSFFIDKVAQYPHSMDLKINGEIDGFGKLSFGWTDTSFYKTDTISNKFEMEYKADWYNDTCFVKFEPIDMTNGNMIIDYKIYSSRK